MYERDFQARIAKILIFGHLGLFCYGLLIATLPFGTKFEVIDTIHVLLMGLPMLLATSLAAFDTILGGRSQKARGAKVPDSVVQITTIVSAGAVLIGFVLYSLMLFDAVASIAIMKALIGAVETVLGGYLGKIRDHLFPPRVGADAGAKA